MVGGATDNVAPRDGPRTKFGSHGLPRPSGGAVPVHDPTAGPGPALTEMYDATARLSEALSACGDTDLAGPSLLPGWTRGHVVTHLARNADALLNLVNWATTGRETPMYPSREVRDADIAAGAGRAAAEQLTDLAESARRLEESLAAMPSEAQERMVATASAQFPGREIPLVRVREVEIHHVD